MKTKTIVIGLIILGVIIGGFIVLRQLFFPPKKVEWYALGKAQKRNISQVILASGTIEAEDTLKIGSIVPGVTEKMLKEENDPVKKGDLIAIIDDGKGDTDVREAKGYLEQAKSDLEYQTAYFYRQKALYKAKQLSQDGFDKVNRDYKDAQALVNARQAAYDRAKLIFDNKKIRAPEDGLILKKVSTEGETVTLASPATIIYEIAKNIKKMEVKLEVDENSIGSLKQGEKVFLTFDTYPYKRFVGKIQKISNAPIIKKTAVSYEASFLLDNSELLLRPGMTVNARIMVGEKDDVLALPSHVFAINPNLLEKVAQLHNVSFQKIDKKKRQKLHEKGNYNTIWVKENNSFIEKPVEIGINDTAYFEIVSGLKGDEQIVFDIYEPDTMEELYSKLFGKGL